jgi:hypothetical protein
MDPFIEAPRHHLWEDFHNHLIDDIHRALAEVLPERYVVRVAERSYIALEDFESQHEHAMQPDVAVAMSPAAWRAIPQGGGTVAVAEPTTDAASAPVIMRALMGVEYREIFVEIRELSPDRKLITCLEVLSPSNKRFGTVGWYQYTRKRDALLRGAANLVEIDLLRGGQRMPMEPERPWPASPYYLLVARKEQTPECTVWPAFSLQPLPVLLVPLAPPDADVPLNLQPLIDGIYARSRYYREIDYRQALQPPLSTAEAEWLAQRAGGTT